MLIQWRYDKNFEMKKKQRKQTSVIPSNIEESYLKELDTNPKYSLEVDPLDKYHFCDAQKDFIKFYCDYKNVGTAAELACIDIELAKAYFISFDTQSEIRRINLAMYQRQFATKLASIDQIGGYLTSLLIDAVPTADRLKTTDKLRVAQMIIDLNKLKIEGFSDPATVMSKDLDLQIKDLSIETIKTLLQQSNPKTKKTIDVTNFSEVLTPEESAYLETLPTDDLLKIIEETKGDKHET